MNSEPKKGTPEVSDHDLKVISASMVWGLSLATVQTYTKITNDK
jgi:hypothetical protein